MKQVHLWVGLVSVVGLVACSGDEAGGGRTSGSGGQGGDQAGVGAGAGGDFGDGPRAATGGTTGGGTTTIVTDGGVTLSSREPVLIDDCGANNAAGISDADAQALKAGGGAASMRVLYPYDGTVFPRGLLAPLWMWDGADPQVLYVHIKSSLFEYHGCLVPTAPGQLQLPQDVWDTAGAQTLGPQDPFTVEITEMTGGTVTGPVVQQLVIAQATLKGSIYYNSYSSALAGLSGGVVLRIPPGGQAEAFTALECNGCHSVSANGSRMVSQTVALGGRAFELTPGGAANPPSLPGPVRNAFAALYPDGSHYLEGYAGAGIEVARSALTAGLISPPEAVLYETDTAAVVPAPTIPTTAMMPTFSPDGTKLVFTDVAINNAHGLAIMAYDTSTHTASDYRVLHETADATMRPGWPFVLPDNGGVVFVETAGADFSGDGAGIIPGLPLGSASDLYMVDVDSGESTLLARAMGFATPQDAASGNTYLPFGAAELHKNYFPTVSPVAAGGYFWVFFDGVRHYGNQGETRQLWGFALAIAPDGNYGVDRSHPPFYLPGQEFGTGNHRAFAALDPCRQDGEDCNSGIDCCGGFCFFPEETSSEFGQEPVGSCTSDTPTCAKTNERCTSTADCCPPEAGEPANSCIAGFCAFVPVPE